jgi:hypothetical protein
MILQTPTTSINDGPVNFFDIPMDGIQDTDELSDYLAAPLEKVGDPIGWWWDHRMVYPRLARMAFDYLSIPGSSSALSISLKCV